MVKPTKLTELLKAHAASFSHGSPSKKMQIIGVYGRDGSAVTIAALANILKTAGQNVGIITQDYVEIAGQRGSGSNQAHPIDDTFRLHSLLAQMRRAKCRYALLDLPPSLPGHQFTALPLAMLVVRRVADDYLDQVSAAASIAQFKKLLKKATGVIILPLDDSAYTQVGKLIPPETTLTYGTGERADAKINKVQMHPKGSSIQLNIDTQTALSLTSQLTTKQTIYSLTAAAAAAYMLHIEINQIEQGVASLKPQSKSAEHFKTDRPYQIVLDSSLSPQGIAEVLESLKHFVKNRLVVVISASLNQPAVWRSAVGEVVAKYSGRVIVTDGDWLPTEDPAAVRQQIIQGVRRTGSDASTEEIADRAAALQKAVSLARRGDIIVVCCSTPRPYRQMGSERQKWSDQKIFEEVL